MKKVILALAVVFCGAAENALAQNGLVTCDTWSGATISDPQELADNPTLLGTPSSTTLHANFDAPVNTAGKFVRRCRAQIVTPVVGNHVFWMASNGKGKLWLSTDQVYIGQAPIARMMQAVAPSRNLWTRYAEQKSATITFASGTTYYLMLIYVDSVTESPTNINHAGVKWMLPNGTQQGPIPGSALKVPPALVTTSTLTATPSTIQTGQTTVLDWTCNGTATASNNGGLSSWNGAKPASGTQGITLSASTAFSLSCSGPGGVVTKSVSVSVTTPTPAPVVTLTANPTTIEVGESTTLTLTTSYASSCTASNDSGEPVWTGSKSTSVSQAVSPTASTVFSVTCTGTGGMTTQTVSVTVNPATGNGEVTLAWDPSPDQVAGYSLAWGPSSGTYNQSVALPQDAVQHEVTELADGVYYFAVRAFDSAGLYSVYSNEVSVTITNGAVEVNSINMLMTASPMFTSSPAEGDGDVSLTRYEDEVRDASNQIEMVKSPQDYWVEDPLQNGWKAAIGWTWEQNNPEDPAVVVQHNWVLSSVPGKTLPGPEVQPRELLSADEGKHFWASVQYLPDAGNAFGTVTKPGGNGIVTAVKLVWLYHIAVADRFANFYPTAAVAVLENNHYAIYTRDQQGVWKTTTLPASGKFQMVLPDLANWVTLQNVKNK